MYTIRNVYYDKGLQYVVVNTETKVIQSVWSDYIDAKNVVIDLNRYRAVKCKSFEYIQEYNKTKLTLTSNVKLVLIK